MDIEVKRKPRKTSTKHVIEEQESNPRTLRWGIGMVLLAVGAYLFIVVFSHFLNWQSDLSGDSLSGSFGVVTASLLVGESFGLFGIFLPVMLMVLGVKIICRSLKIVDRTLISLGIITILGSLSLGAAFGTHGDMFNSGWGGAFGIEISTLLKGYIGTPGVVILLILCWIFTGVFINSRVIELVNGIGSGIADKSKDVVDKVTKHRPHAAPAQNEPQAESESADESVETTEPQGETTTEPTAANEPEQKIEQDEDDDTEESQEVVFIPEQEPVETMAEPETVPEPKDVLVVEVETPEGDKELSERDAESIPFNPDRTKGYNFPPLDLLEERESASEVSDEEIEENTRYIREILADFKISIVDIKATTGPTVTLYEVVQERGVKVAKIEGLSKEIAQSLKASSVRVAPIPERGTIGIEVPNRKPAIVSMRSALRTERFVDFKAELPVVVGRNIQNECIVFDLAKMPHLLVAGATGTGKSVGLNVILTSLLYRKDPSQLKLVLIDPKQVEFSLYEGLSRHFLARMESEEENIVIDAQKAVYTLYSLCAEMEERLKKCRLVGTRNIAEYNDLVRKCKIESRELMPYIVVVIDEYADLVTQSKLVEQPVMRLAQKARAAGIHLILATQRPSVDILTGRIKTNFPARIAFRVSSRVDSQTIIDQPGANSLIGRGDMLFSEPCALTRVQCAFVDTPEVKRIVDYVASQPSPTGMPYTLPDYEESGGASTATAASVDSGMGSESGAAVRYDALFAEIARDAVSGGDNFSTSYIQRTYEVGFVRAGRIMLQLERAGIVGPQVAGAKSRDVKIFDLPTLEARLQELGVE